MFGDDDEGSVRDEEIDRILDEYDVGETGDEGRVKSREYQEYRKAEREHKKRTVYERFVDLTSFFTFTFEDMEEEHRNSLNLLQYDIDPEQVAPASIVAGAFTMAVAAAVVFFLPWLPTVFKVGALLMPLTVFYYLLKYPSLKARQKVVESSENLIMAVLYMVISMRASPSLERAVAFAARHLRGPIAKDFKTILWKVDMREQLTMRKAVRDYVQVWKPYNKGFVESVNLLISSLSEANEEKRNEILSDSINQFLDNTRDQMKEFAQTLQMPVMVLYGLGILLPVLGTVLLPLIATFMGGGGIIYYLIFFYNILLPALVVFIMQNLLVSRPVSFSSRSGKLEGVEGGKIEFEVLGREIRVNVLFLSIPLFIILAAWPATHYYSIIASGSGFPVSPSTVTLLREMMLVLAVAVAGGAHLILGYRSVLEKQKEIEDMEREFPQALFQLGNLLDRGTPVEVAVSQVGEEVRGNLEIAGMFDRISENIRRQGMTFREAVFDSEYGALKQYPSKLMETVMEITLESTERGTSLAAKSLQHISSYLQDIQETQERLEELVGDTLSSLQFLGYILSPVIAGIAVGMGSVISISFSAIGGTINNTAANATAGAGAPTGISGGSVGILSVFNFQSVIPPGVLQLVVGVYLLQLSAVVGTLYVRLDEGRNPPRRNVVVGRMMLSSLIFYTLTVLVIVLVFGSMIRGVVG
ncbi:MAG: hypothetical protein ABEJ83_04505 [Candidatus Nanohaloarchaea archaeon]